MFRSGNGSSGSDSSGAQPHGARGSRRLIGRASRRVDSEAILESLDTAVVVRGMNGLVSAWNRGAERLYGYPAAEILGRTYSSIVPEARRDSEEEATNAAARVGLSDIFDTQRISRDGAAKEVTVHVSPLKDTAGVTVGVSSLEYEVRPDSRALWASLPDDYYPRGAFEEAPVAMAILAATGPSAGRFLRVNRSFSDLTGYPVEDLLAASLGMLLHRDDVATDLAATRRLDTAELASFQLEQRLLHAHRHVVWVSVDATLVRDPNGDPLYYVRQLQDVGERRRYEGELGYLVEHDPLTGLLNRRGFVRELAHEMAYSRRYGAEGSVLFVDLDDLKWVNDTLGHNAGDEVISEVARILGERLRDTDALARLGGDEFSVLLPHTSAREAEIVSASLISAVSETCAVALPAGRSVTLSVGVNTFDAGDAHLTPDDVIIDADRAMYAAKEAGKNRVAVASAKTHARDAARISWSERVRGAVEEGLFELVCQPIIDFRSDGVSQWELLLRLPGENGELILPAQFLYTAERSDLILEIDRWVLGEAMRLIAEQANVGRTVRLEVNISGRSVGDPQMLQFIEENLERTAIAPSSLILEVTETAAIANIDRARGFASTLQKLGCCFALDDFGAGFGSFYYLKHIPFDYVKIDGEFIRNLPTSKTDQLILDSIVQMSRGLEKHTVAEFVEDSETVEVLKEHGVDYGQGFHLGKPLPVSTVLSV